MPITDLVNTGLGAFIASVLAEIINRGLGFEGRKAFLTFIGLAGAVLAIQVGAAYVPQLSHVWDWLVALMVMTAIGTGHHQLVSSRNAQGQVTIDEGPADPAVTDVGIPNVQS